VKDGFSGKKFPFTQYSNDLKIYSCKNNKWQFLEVRYSMQVILIPISAILVT
jgi:hypothetical protein